MKAMKSPLARARAELVAALMWPLVPRRTMRIRGSAAAAACSRAQASPPGEASSARHSSHFGQTWDCTEAMAASRWAGSGSKTGITTEINGPFAASRAARSRAAARSAGVSVSQRAIHRA